MAAKAVVVPEAADIVGMEGIIFLRESPMLINFRFMAVLEVAVSAEMVERADRD